MFDNEELPETFLPVTPVYRVLSAGSVRLMRIVEAHDQKVKIGVTNLGLDLLDLARMHGREIDVEVDPGKWIRVRPDGSMMPAPRPRSLDCFAKLKRRHARRERRAARRAALRAWWSMKVRRRPDSGGAALPVRHRRPGSRVALPTISPGWSRPGRQDRVSDADAVV